MKTSALKGVRDEHRLAHTAINYLLSIFQTLASQYGAMAIVSRWHEYFFKNNNLLILNMRFVCYFFFFLVYVGGKGDGGRAMCYCGYFIFPGLFLVIYYFTIILVYFRVVVLNLMKEISQASVKDDFAVNRVTTRNVEDA